MVLAFAQNVSFSIVSRSRNRDNLTYHMIASVFSNGIWFLTFRELVLSEMSFALFIPYTLGTVSGSLVGSKVSMLIERVIGASADGHITKARVPKAGDLARCSLGFLGQITSSEMQEVSYVNGDKGVAYVGVHMENRDGVKAGDPWASRNPTLVS